MGLGQSEKFEGACFGGVTGVTVVVYMDASFEPEECQACNAVDLSEMGGNFCAYRVEIPCETISVECGEPSGAPSGSFYPSSAPSEGPTKSPAPSSNPTALPSASPTDAPTKSPTNAPTNAPTGNPTEGPTTSPSTSPSSSPSSSPSNKPSDSPTGSPTKSPTGSPSDSPTSSPSNAPTTDPSSSPSTSPTGSPTGGPTPSPGESPSEGPTASPSSSPTAFPTKSMMPTNCDMPAEPKVVASICMSGESTLDTRPMPEDALIVTNQNDEKVDFTVSQAWIEEGAGGMAIMYDESLDSPSCIVKGNVKFGDSEDYKGECFGGVTGVTVVVYMDASFEPEECQACDVDDLSEMGGNFCAYRVEIPCETISVECGEPSGAPSGSFY